MISLHRRTRAPALPSVPFGKTSRWPRRLPSRLPACAPPTAHCQAAESHERIRSTGRASRSGHLAACWLETSHGEELGPESPTSHEPLARARTETKAGRDPEALRLACRLSSGERHVIAAGSILAEVAAWTEGTATHRRRVAPDTATATPPGAAAWSYAREGRIGLRRVSRHGPWAAGGFLVRAPGPGAARRARRAAPVPPAAAGRTSRSVSPRAGRRLRRGAHPTAAGGARHARRGAQRR